jgi:hypothetical protein
MRKVHFTFIVCTLLLVSCSKQEEPATHSLDSASLPGITTGAPIEMDSTGLVIDRTRLRTPRHQQLLARFEPTQVVEIYRDFRPLRNRELTQGQLDAFLKQKSISFEELQAILGEGDALGWQQADTTSAP